MRITILAVGSRGDVQPTLALALGLQEAGHQVRLAALEPFGEWIASHQIPFVSLGKLPERFTRRQGKKRVPSFNGAFGRLLFWLVYSNLLESRLEAFTEACRDSDAIVFGGLAFPGYHLAEYYGVPSFWASPVPHTKTEVFVDPFFSHLWYMPEPQVEDLTKTTSSSWKKSLCGLSYDLEEQLRLQVSARRINRWRKKRLGLPALHRSQLAAHLKEHISATLYACSSHLVTPPTDWADNVYITGNWYLKSSEDWTPSPSLLSFLEEGSRPVYIGFGTMNEREPQKLAQLAIQAVVQSGQRGILSGFELDGKALPKGVISVSDVPHEWLFQQVSLVVHHGGAGTTAAASRAGVPSIVIPFAYDQHFWARRLQIQGSAGPSISRKALTASRLAQSIDDTLKNTGIIDAAQELRQKILEEEGVQKAISVIEEKVKT